MLALNYEVVLLLTCYLSSISLSFPMYKFLKLNQFLKPVTTTCSSLMITCSNSLITAHLSGYLIRLYSSRSTLGLKSIAGNDVVTNVIASIPTDKKKTKSTITKTRSKKTKQQSVSSITEDEARVELIELDERIKHHDILYYDSNLPEISDAEYDKLIRRAEAIVGRFVHLRNLVSKIDNGVGGSRSQRFPPFQHSKPMLSLSNVFNSEEISQFIEKIYLDIDKLESMISDARKVTTDTAYDNEKNIDISFVVEPKIDGLSFAVRYSHEGILIGAGTRGDGEVGENLTANAFNVIGIPHKLEKNMLQSLSRKLIKETILENEIRNTVNMADTVNNTTVNSNHASQIISCDDVNIVWEIRGEVYITHEDFTTLNENKIRVGKEPFSTARNAAAGSLRQLQPEEIISRKLRFLAYSLHTYDLFQHTSQESGHVQYH